MVGRLAKLGVPKSFQSPAGDVLGERSKYEGSDFSHGEAHPAMRLGKSAAVRGVRAAAPSRSLPRLGSVRRGVIPGSCHSTDAYLTPGVRPSTFEKMVFWFSQFCRIQEFL